MGANENTGDKMKKALKRIWDGPVETKADEESPKEEGKVEVLQTETPKDAFAADDRSVQVAPPTAAEFNTLIKENLLKFESAKKEKEENLFAPSYNAGRKGEPDMMSDTAIDNTTDIFSAAPVSASSEVTTISKGTSIVGEIHSDSNIDLLGTMKGNVITKGNVNVSGKVLGDIKGANVDLSGCTVQGNIIASGMLTIDNDSVLVGDIKAENLSINGKLKGNAQIRNMFTCQSEALILGNVTAAVASINEGAKLQGTMQIVNGQIADIKISEEEANGWIAKAPNAIPTILDK